MKANTTNLPENGEDKEYMLEKASVKVRMNNIKINAEFEQIENDREA